MTQTPANASSTAPGVEPLPAARSTLSRRSRRFLLGLAGIALLALALRLTVCAQLATLPAVQDPATTTDMATYKRLAQEILGGRIPEYFYYQPLYYAVFLPVVYGLFGTNPWSVMAVQAVLGAATVWLAGLIAARLFGRWAGLVAAVLLALARYHIFQTPFLLLEVLQGFWLTLLCYLTLRAWESDRGWRWALTALVLSAAVLTRGNALLLAPAVLLLFAWRRRRSPVRVAAGVALILAVVYLPQLPFALHNWHHYGRWTGPSSAEDAVLALGNTPEAPPGGLLYTASFQEWMRRADLPPDQRVPVTHHILNWFRQEPLAFVELKAEMLLLFWHRQEIANNVSLAVQGEKSRLLRAPVLLDFLVIGGLGLTGLLLAWRRRSPRRLFLTGIVVLFWLATVVFYVLARFRLPIVPILCIFGGAAAQHGRFLWHLSRRRVPKLRPRVLAALLALTFGFVLVFHGFTFYQDCFGKAILRQVRPYGVFVETRDLFRAYDHGPAVCGGWGLLPIPPDGLLVVKDWRLPPRAPFAVLAGCPLRVRLPLYGRPGDAAELVVQSRAGPSQSVQIEFGGTSPQWVEVPLAPVALTADTLQIGVAIRPVKGKLALAVDNNRDYGRTSLVNAAGQTAAVPAEAVVEMDWLRHPPTAPPDPRTAFRAPERAPDTVAARTP